MLILTKYDDLNVTPVGYPDYLHYIDKDQKYVQSWWKWSGKSKKTGEVFTIHFVQFDQFNNDGKIDFEEIMAISQNWKRLKIKSKSILFSH